MALVFAFLSLILADTSWAAVRAPAVAGSFYPEDTDALVRTMRSFFAQTPFYGHSLPESVVLMAPHAGYVFSGPTAASAYAQLRGKEFDHIVLLGPCHKGLPPPGISVFWKGAEDAFETPLGRMPIDPLAHTFADALNGDNQDPLKMHAGEHSLEVHIPFLQTLFGDQPIIPILVNDVMAAHLLVAELTKHLASKRVLYVVSTDLSHYLPKAEAEKKDRETLTLLSQHSPTEVRQKTESDSNRMCGNVAAYVGAELVKRLGLPPLTFTGYAQSGDSTPSNTDSVVGYGAGLTFSQSEALSQEEGKTALSYARQVLEAAFSGRPLKEEPLLPQKKGVFVTLRVGNQLRGCMGTTEPTLPLAEAIAYFTQAAAFQDKRFSPLTAAELPNVTIEVSVLSSPYPIASYQGIVPDQDGATVRYGNKQGVFLPEVWKGMPRTTFFEELCAQKAGLARTCYRNPAVALQGFHTQVFSE